MLTTKSLISTLQRNFSFAHALLDAAKTDAPKEQPENKFFFEKKTMHRFIDEDGKEKLISEHTKSSDEDPKKLKTIRIKKTLPHGDQKEQEEISEEVSDVETYFQNKKPQIEDAKEKKESKPKKLIERVKLPFKHRKDRPAQRQRMVPYDVFDSFFPRLSFPSFFFDDEEPEFFEFERSIEPQQAIEEKPSKAKNEKKDAKAEKKEEAKTAEEKAAAPLEEKKEDKPAQQRKMFDFLSFDKRFEEMSKRMIDMEQKFNEMFFKTMKPKKEEIKEAEPKKEEVKEEKKEAEVKKE